MNKYSLAEAKIGDIFRHIETGVLYRLDKINIPSGRQAMGGYPIGITYDFFDLHIKHPWTLSKKQFMQQLKPAPEVARILYANV